MVKDSPEQYSSINRGGDNSLSRSSVKRKRRFRDMLSTESLDFVTFKRIIIESSKMDIYPFFTPREIDLDLLSSGIDKIQALTNKTGNEHSRICFADIFNDRLVWGKISSGDKNSCLANMDKPTDVGIYKEVISAHTHPNALSALRFSEVDYIGFLSNDRLFISILSCCETKLMIVKTESTRQKIKYYNSKSLYDDVCNIFKEENQTIDNSSLLKYKQANQLMCIEFGMSMYIKISGDVGDIFKKVDIFDGLEQ